MSSAFTTLFLYNGNTYTAVISQLDDAINIYVPDETLHDLLPQGKITIHSAQVLKINQHNLGAAQRLVQNILCSIDQRKIDNQRKE